MKSTDYSSTLKAYWQSVGLQILDLLVKCGLISSKGEGRRLITQNGISVNDAKVTDIFQEIKEDDFTNNELVIKKGKKVHHKVNLVDNKVSIGDLI